MKALNAVGKTLLFMLGLVVTFFTILGVVMVTPFATNTPPSFADIYKANKFV